jgi:hypothetical protein
MMHVPTLSTSHQLTNFEPKIPAPLKRRLWPRSPAPQSQPASLPSLSSFTSNTKRPNSINSSRTLNHRPRGSQTQNPSFQIISDSKTNSHQTSRLAASWRSTSRPTFRQPLLLPPNSNLKCSRCLNYGLKTMSSYSRKTHQS